MKRILLCLLVLVQTSLVYSQDCTSINSAQITSTGGNNYKLTVSYTSTGQKHLYIYIYCGAHIPANIITQYCVSTNCNCTGTHTKTFVCSGTPSAMVGAYDNDCGDNSQGCGTTIVGPPVGMGPMPVLIENFYAKRNNNVVSLSWKTLTEINAKEFIIQKNTGSGFVDVKTVTAYNRANGASYIITDNDISKATISYRIKMIDFDGTYTNSDTRTVKGTATTVDYTVFPNPASSNGKVSITDISEPTDIQLIDNTGRIIKNVLMDNNNKMDLNNVQTGIYQIRLHTRSSNTIVTRKLTVVN